MHRYHYASLDAQAFLAACRVPAPGPDAYLAQDPETEALRALFDKGYRLLTLDSSSGLAVFEKALPHNHTQHLVRSMNAMQAVRDLVAGVEQAIEHAQGKSWRLPDIESLVTTLIPKKTNPPMKTINVTVSPTGDIQIDAVGFHGADCEQATRFLEEALGLTLAREKKPEWHQRSKAKTQQRLGS